MAKKVLKYEPDYAVSPGATLREALEERGISQSDLAARTEMATKTISQIVNGVAPITYETAEKLEMALGIPSHFWNQCELTYREALAKIEAKSRLESSVEWLKEIPVKVLRERRLISDATDSSETVRQVLKFFGVSSVDAWRATWGEPAAQYRGQNEHKKKPGYVAAWLRIGELQSASVDTPPFCADEFRRALSDVRKMTTLTASQWKVAMPARCALAGVSVVLTPEIPGAAVSGATRWLTKDKALIQLSLKFKSNDQIWFTFFHEAGHILLHSKKQKFVEFGHSEETLEEREANEFARDILIPPAFANGLAYLKNRDNIRAFAESIGIDAGIVAGRLQHDKLLHPALVQSFGLKRTIEWSKT